MFAVSLFLVALLNFVTYSFAVQCQIFVDPNSKVGTGCGSNLATACKSVMDGIDAASQISAGDLQTCAQFSINLASATYIGPKNTQIEFQVQLANNSLPIVFNGIGNKTTIIDSQENGFGWAVNIAAGQQITFSKLHFTNARRNSGAGGALALVCDPLGQVTVDQCTFVNNGAPQGGAVAMQAAGSLTVGASQFTNNIATQSAHNPDACEQGGGAIYVAGDPTQTPNVKLDVELCEFVQNTALLACGGAILTVGTPDVSVGFTKFEENSAVNGGAIGVVGCRGTQIWGGLSMTANNASAHGGAIYMSDDTHTVEALTAVLNRAGEAGGAVYIVKSAVTIVDSVFTSNEALTFGGAIAIEQHALVKTSTGNLLNNVTAAANSAPQGTALYCAAASEIIPPFFSEQELCLSSCIDPKTSKCACNKCTEPAPTHGPATPAPTPESSSPWPAVLIVLFVIFALVGGAAAFYWWRKRSAGGRATFLNI